GKGSGTPTEPHYTPFPEVESSHPTTSSILLPSITTARIPTVTHTVTTPIIQYSRRARIAQSSALLTVADEPASPGEGSGTPTEPHHTPFPEADTSYPTTSSIPLPSIPTAPIPSVTQLDPTPIRQYSRRARIAQSSALPIVADEPASPVRDVSKGEACPTDSGFIADQDRATIAKSSTLPHDSVPRVTSPAVDKGSMQHTISKLTALYTSLQRQYSELLEKFQAQEEEIVILKETIAKDVEVARIHSEEELQGMIDSLDKSNETIAKYLQEYQDFASELPLEKRIELISDLVKYKDNYSKVYKFQSQQRRPMTKKQKREYYKSNQI
nr:hypothetical protein [Tanacetum cinerariifolium]